MVDFLKRSKPEGEKWAEDEKVRKSVEEILNNIEKRGDPAIRELSRKFDNFSPDSFRLSEDEVRKCMEKVDQRDLDDIIFAQKQIRRFAEAQLGSIKDIELETICK